MQVVCVRPFGFHKPGDVVDVPDGAEVSPVYFAPVTPPPAPETPAEAVTEPPSGAQEG